MPCHLYMLRQLMKDDNHDTVLRFVRCYLFTVPSLRYLAFSRSCSSTRVL